jgi:ribosomal protein S18 acetylase RimI-like enzyme
MEEPGRKRKKAEIIIRQMEIDDISAVYHLGETLFTSDDYPFLYRTWDPYEVTEYFTSDPDYCLVAEREDKIVGFILGTTIEKEGTAWKKYGYLTWIGIDETFQRTGLGLRLYRKLEEKFQQDGVRMVMADTEASNKEAIAFFKVLGFSSARQHLWLAKTLRAPAKKRGSRTDSPLSTNGPSRQKEGRAKKERQEGSEENR